jgi:hypothetical protein
MTGHKAGYRLRRPFARESRLRYPFTDLRADLVAGVTLAATASRIVT